MRRAATRAYQDHEGGVDSGGGELLVTLLAGAIGAGQHH